MPQDDEKQRQKPPAKPGVRFASEDTVHTLPSSNKRSLDEPADPLMDQTMHSRQSQPRKRPRRDEQKKNQYDDDDDGGAEGDDDDDSVNNDEDNVDMDMDPDASDSLPSERDLLLAKERRRQRREAGGGDSDDDDDKLEETKVDRTTSLAAEGIAFEPFNMSKEQSDGTGYFDGDTYVFRKRQDDEEPDAWLESLQEQGDSGLYTTAAAAATGNDDSESETDESSSAVKMDDWSKNDLYACIIPLVSDTETIMQAIARYGNLVKRKPGGRAADSMASSEATKAAQESILRLTEAASALLLQGQVDIYQMTRNQLLAESKDLAVHGNGSDRPRSAAAAPSNAVPSIPKEVVEWEYQGSQDGQIHGPYSTQNMRGWIQAGYFVGPSAVKVRSIAQRERTKTAQEDLLDDLDSDNDEDDNAKPQATETVRGEWLQSDQVDFSQYA